MQKDWLILQRQKFIHFLIYESDEDVHVKRFTDTMDRMKQAMSIGKQIKYKFGYSNFAFDLWIVLHKIDCNGALPHRRGISGIYKSELLEKTLRVWTNISVKIILKDV